MAACGIAPEDDDGNAAKPPARQPKPPIVDVETLILGMEATKTVEGLKTAFANAWKVSEGSEAVKAAYDRLKKIMEAS
jgi:hypothetical protein